MEKFRAIFDSAYGPVIVEKVVEYMSDATVRFVGRRSSDGARDEYLAYLDEVRIVPVVA